MLGIDTAHDCRCDDIRDLKKYLRRSRYLSISVQLRRLDRWAVQPPSNSSTTVPSLLRQSVRSSRLSKVMIVSPSRHANMVNVLRC